MCRLIKHYMHIRNWKDYFYLIKQFMFVNISKVEILDEYKGRYQLL